MKSKLAAIAIGMCAWVGTAHALPADSNWMIGSWQCTKGRVPGVIKWSYPPTKCAHASCASSGLAQKPEGKWTPTGGAAEKLTYVSGDADDFKFTFASAPQVPLPMQKSSNGNGFSGGLPIGEMVSIRVSCTRSTNPRTSILGGVSNIP